MTRKVLLMTILSMNIFSLFGQKPKDLRSADLKFKDAETTACIVCDHVLSRERPILYAAHDSDGAWQFLCGVGDHTVENAKLISLKQATEIDQTMNELYEMPVNMSAERTSVKDKWVVFRMED